MEDPVREVARRLLAAMSEQVGGRGDLPTSPYAAASQIGLDYSLLDEPLELLLSEGRVEPYEPMGSVAAGDTPGGNLAVVITREGFEMLRDS